MIPVVGETADLVNAGISVCRGNYLDAAISLVSMIPVAGAAGPLLKALKKLPPSLTKHLDDLLEVLKDLLKKLDLKKLVDGASKFLDDFLDLLKKKNKALGEWIEDFVCKHITGHCFVAGTLVHTAKGPTVIEEIRAGDLVWSKSEESGEIGYQRVLGTSIREVNKVIQIRAGGEEIQATPEHPFWVYGKRYVKAEDLEVGDELFVLEKETGELETKEIEEVKIILLEERSPVYNFEVENWNSYFVGEVGVLVHNYKPVADGNLSNEILIQIDKFSEDRMNHIINGSGSSNHHWERLVPDKDPDKIKALIAEVMDTGIEGPYKSVYSRTKNIGGEVVEVTYAKLHGGSIRISDAWIR